MYKTRSRMVSFRLSEDEYERLKDLSVLECARSVSEFARATLCKMPGGNGEAPESAAPRMEKLEGAVVQLRLELRQLRQLVEHTLDRAPSREVAASFQETNQ